MTDTDPIPNEDKRVLITMLVGHYNWGWPEKKMAAPLNVLRINRLFIHKKVQFKLYEGLPVTFEQWQR